MFTNSNCLNPPDSSFLCNSLSYRKRAKIGIQMMKMRMISLIGQDAEFTLILIFFFFNY